MQLASPIMEIVSFIQLFWNSWYFIYIAMELCSRKLHVLGGLHSVQIRQISLFLSISKETFVFLLIFLSFALMCIVFQCFIQMFRVLTNILNENVMKFDSATTFWPTDNWHSIYVLFSFSESSEHTLHFKEKTTNLFYDISKLFLSVCNYFIQMYQNLNDFYKELESPELTSPHYNSKSKELYFKQVSYPLFFINYYFYFYLLIWSKSVMKYLTSI